MMPTPEPAFATALGAERSYLMRYARTKLRDSAAAEDAVQDTLLAALTSHGRFERRASLRTWLTGILLHKIVDAVRRGRGAAVVVEAAEPGEAEVDDPLAINATNSAPGGATDEAVDWHDPERVVAARQAAQALALRMGQLDPIVQRLCVLQGVEGLSTGEAARELGLSPAHGAQLLHRARTRLRRGLQQAQLV